jgi:hypothetical protein
MLLLVLIACVPVVATLGTGEAGDVAGDEDLAGDGGDEDLAGDGGESGDTGDAGDAGQCACTAELRATLDLVARTAGTVAPLVGEVPGAELEAIAAEARALADELTGP